MYFNIHNHYFVPVLKLINENLYENIFSGFAGQRYVVFPDNPKGEDVKGKKRVL